MKKSVLMLAALLLTMLTVGCSSTTLTGSWASPELIQPVDKVYVVGISRHETHRRIFEDEFGRQLQQYAVRTHSSYKDFKDVQNVELDVILEKVRAVGADSLLMTRIMGKRTEEVVNPARVTGYTYDHPFYSRGGYSPRPYYRNYRDYYDRRYELTYEPATITRYQIVTLESNLYASASGDLIWSAQLETTMTESLEKMVEDFIKVVIGDLNRQGVL
ncbi:MAG: hypothetical protein RQ723_04165 [Desulfuromonadales bacterium]|nr:hypothetical protein [Desulfuromonadales bacterium]